jgi:hypothetical protein
MMSRYDRVSILSMVPTQAGSANVPWRKVGGDCGLIEVPLPLEAAI